MSVVQLFNREHRAFDDFSAVNRKQGRLDRRNLRLRLYYPVGGVLLSSAAIALVIWRGGFSRAAHQPGMCAPANWLHASAP